MKLNKSYWYPEYCRNEIKTQTNELLKIRTVHDILDFAVHFLGSSKNITFIRHVIWTVSKNHQTIMLLYKEKIIYLYITLFNYSLHRTYW